MTAHWKVRRHWLVHSCASLAGLVLSFIACFILLVIAPLTGFQCYSTVTLEGRACCCSLCSCVTSTSSTYRPIVEVIICNLSGAGQNFKNHWGQLRYFRGKLNEIVRVSKQAIFAMNINKIGLFSLCETS